MWARKPNNKLAKQFCKVLYSTSTEEWLGASYRKSALIPTCDAPKIKPCTVIIHARYTIEISSHGGISQHNSTNKNNTSCLIQARGHEGSNTTAREHKVSGSKGI